MYGIHRLLNDIFCATLLPGFLISFWLTGIIAFTTLKVSLIFCFLLFVIAPLIFKFSITLQRGIVFLTFIAYPSNLSFTHPERHGLYATRNFYITHKGPDDEVEVTLGMWHILPNYVAKKFSNTLQLNESTVNKLIETDIPEKQEIALSTIEHQIEVGFGKLSGDNESKFYEEMLRVPGTQIILYLHGNTASRGAPHRIEMYQVLRSLGYHVIAIDYRNYGDSGDSQMTENGVISDAIAAYNYIRNRTTATIFLWGHSLGTGVSTHMMAQLTRANIPGPRAVILESPFNNIREEIRAHPFSKLFKNLPWFDYMVTNPMYSNQLRFESDRHITEFPQPIAILHAEDDVVVPFKLGYKLYRTALDRRRKTSGPIEFHRFESISGFGHKYICRSPDLPAIVQRFFNTYLNEVY